MKRIIRRTWRVDGVLTDVTSAKLSDPTGTFGIKRLDTGAVVVPDSTDMSHVSTGVYQYEFEEPVEGIGYTAFVEIVYLGQTYHFETDFSAIIAAPEPGMGVSYSSLIERVGRAMFGIREGFSAAQLDDLHDCLRDGLHAVYAAHRWSFLRPLQTITTESGVDSYELPLEFDSLEGDLTYEPGKSDYYPPVRVVQESEVRRWRQDDDLSGRPRLAAVVPVKFDPTVGSRRQIMFYPVPDAAYILTARMRLRPLMLSEANPYPIGGEALAEAITESCLAAAERYLDEREGVHAKRFMEALAAAIAADRDASSPDHLGPDRGGEEPWEPSPLLRVGEITFNGEVM